MLKHPEGMLCTAVVMLLDCCAVRFCVAPEYVLPCLPAMVIRTHRAGWDGGWDGVDSTAFIDKYAKSEWVKPLCVEDRGFFLA